MADNKTSIVLTADDKATAVINKVGGALGGLANPAAAASAALSSLAGGAALAGLGAMAKSAIDAADGLYDLSQRTGIAVKDLATYKLAAEQSGTSLDGVAKGIKGLSKAMLDNGEALKAAGITAKDANGALRQLADLFSQIEDGPEKLAVGTKLLGKSFQELVPLLNLGSSVLDESAKAAERYGSAMALLAPQADKLNDELAKISIAGQALGAELAAKIVPGMTDIATAMALAAQESGVLKAALVGFGGIADKALNPFAVTLKGLKAELLLFAAEWDELRAKVTFGSVKENAIKSALQNRRDASGVLKELSALDTVSQAAPTEKAKPSDDLLARWKALAASMRDSGKALKEYDVEAEWHKMLMKELAEEEKARLERAKWAAQAADEIFDAEEKERQAIEKSIGGLREKIEAMHLETQTMGLSAAERERTVMLLALEAERVNLTAEAYADLRGKMEEALTASAAKRQAVEAAEASAKAWENFSRDIEQSLTDALMRSFEAGDDFGKAFADNLKNTFKAMILKVAIQAIISPITGQGGLLQQGASALGFNAGGAGNALSAGSNLYNLATGGGFFGGFSAGAASVASELALGASFVGPSATLAGGAVGVGASAAAATGSAAGAGALSSIGAALPWIGGAFALASLMGAFGNEPAPPEMGLRQWARGSNPKYDAAIAAGKPNYVESAFGIMRVASQHIEGDGEAQLNAELAEKFLKPVAALDNLIAAELDRLQVVEIQKLLDDWKPGELESPEGFKGQLEARLGTITDALGGVIDELFDQLDGTLEERYALTLSLLKTHDDAGYADLARELASAAGATAGTVGKLVGTLDSVNDAFDTLGQTLLDISVSGAEAAAGLVEAFGGLDQFAASTGAYFSSYYSDAEKQAVAAGALAAEFGKLGLVLPETKDGFRQMIEAIDISTDGGKALYADLMALGPAFASLADGTQAVIDSAQASVTSAENALRGAYEAQRREIEATIDDLRGYVSELRDFRRSLLLGDLSPLSGPQRLAEARRQYIEVSAAAAGPGNSQYQAALARLPAVSEAYLAVAKEQSASAADYYRDFADVQATLENSASLAEDQISVEQQQLDALTRQVEALVTLNSSTLTVASGISALQQAMGSLTSAIAGLAMGNNNTALQSIIAQNGSNAAAQVGIDQAATDAAALAAATATVDAIKGISAKDIGKITSTAISAIAGAAGSPDTKISGVSKSELQQAITVNLNIASADLGALGKQDLKQIAQSIGLTSSTVKSYDIGTPYVPQDMTANIHEGEIIIDPKSADILRRYGIGMQVGGDAETAAEIAALRAELKAALGAVASNTRQSKDLLDSVVNGANTLRTEVIA